LTTEERKEIVRLYFEVMNSGDVGASAAFWADRPINHGREYSHDDVQKLHESVLQIYERWTLHEVVSEGEWVVCRVTAQGRHKAKPPIPFDSGIFLLTEPDGRPFSFQHIHMFRIVDGKIKEHWANRDDLGAARQLGLELTPRG